MRILIATVQVPFVRGGAEILADNLRDALRAEGHEAEVVAVPLKWYPPERILDALLACRLLDVTESNGNRVDRVIGLKFPAYLIPHPNKVLWLLHQHRTAYDLWGHPQCDLMHHANGARVRQAIAEADRRLIPEAGAVYTIARTVTGRLKTFSGIDSTPLYHPPDQPERFYCAPAEPYLFFPSRLSRFKRQALVLRALSLTKRDVRVRFAGAPDGPQEWDDLQHLLGQLGLGRRVEFLGRVNDEQKRDLYARCRAVVFPPLDEDYGYVTLEAMLASKAVVTCTDSGGPLEFIEYEKTGLVAPPTPEGLAEALDRVWEGGEAAAWGRAGRAAYERMGISWRAVVQRLAA
jgi:glycosyltransferase involved in cell wall biosynthesis